MDNLSLAISEADRIDDLPRAFTYRRQRAREEADAKIAPEARLAPLLDASFGQLAAFFVKCAIAAIPALLLLAAVLLDAMRRTPQGQGRQDGRAAVYNA